MGTLLPTWLGRPGCFSISPVLREDCDSLSYRERLGASLAAVAEELRELYVLVLEMDTQE